MELNDELKLLLIKTGIFKEDAAAQSLLDRIKDNDEAAMNELMHDDLKFTMHKLSHIHN